MGELLRVIFGKHHRQSDESWVKLRYVPGLDHYGRTICIVDAHRDDGKRYVAPAGEKLTAFAELESAICALW